MDNGNPNERRAWILDQDAAKSGWPRSGELEGYSETAFSDIRKDFLNDFLTHVRERKPFSRHEEFRWLARTVFAFYFRARARA